MCFLCVLIQVNDLVDNADMHVAFAMHVPSHVECRFLRSPSLFLAVLTIFNINAPSTSDADLLLLQCTLIRKIVDTSESHK